MGWIVKFSELIGGRDCVFLFLTRFSLPGLEKYCNSCRYMVLGTWVFVFELKKVMPGGFIPPSPFSIIPFQLLHGISRLVFIAKYTSLVPFSCYFILVN